MARVGILLLVALLMSTIATAQFGQRRLDQLQVTSQGNGVLRLDNRSYNLNQTSVNLQQNGQASIALRGQINTTLIGRWSGSIGRQVNLQITRGFDRANTSGNGVLYLSNDFEIERLEISGVTGRSTYVVSFSASGRDPGRGEVRSSARGRGQFRLGFSPPSLVNRVDVELRRNGDAMIRAMGGTDVTLRGRWASGRAGAVQLEITAGLGANTSGRGVLNLDNRDNIVDLDISGTAARQRFQLTFDARGGGGGDDRRQFESTQRGTGALVIAFSRNIPLDRATVVLNRNGEARIAFSGRPDVTFTGRWDRTTTTGNIAQVTITDSTLTGATRGTAYVHLVDDRRFRRIDLFGNVGRDAFSGSFVAQ